MERLHRYERFFMELLMPVKNLILFPLFNIKEQDWAIGTTLAIYIHGKPNMITVHHDALIWSISYRCFMENIEEEQQAGLLPERKWVNTFLWNPNPLSGTTIFTHCSIMDLESLNSQFTGLSKLQEHASPHKLRWLMDACSCGSAEYYLCFFPVVLKNKKSWCSGVLLDGYSDNKQVFL